MDPHCGFPESSSQAVTVLTHTTGSLGPKSDGITVAA